MEYGVWPLNYWTPLNSFEKILKKILNSVLLPIYVIAFLAAIAWLIWTVISGTWTLLTNPGEIESKPGFMVFLALAFGVYLYQLDKKLNNISAALEELKSRRYSDDPENL